MLFSILAAFPREESCRSPSRYRTITAQHLYCIFDSQNKMQIKKMQTPSSVRQKIAQLVFIRFGSNMMPKVEASADFDRAAQIVTEHQIGGVLLFNGGTAEAATSTLAQLQDVSTIPLTVAADMERGMAQQITDLVTWPHALAFDALGDAAVEEVETFARLSAFEARAIGVHVSFSPVADIHRNPKNPIIANRSFATTADRVTELAAAYIRGCHAAGLLCCAKHFPGHGNTHEDSHATMPIVDESLEVLLATDLKPFQRLIDSNVDMFMTAHVAYPSLDPSGKPATLSPPILTQLLRDQWEYSGAVVSDSLKMEGVHAAGACEGDLAVEAIRAGVDLLLDVSDVAEVIDSIEQAANNDSQFALRVSDAFDRAWHIKQKAMSGSPPGDRPALVDCENHAVRVSRAALKTLDDDQRVSLPIASHQSVGFLLVNPLGDNAYTKTNRIVDQFASFDSVNAVHTFGPTAEESISDRVQSKLAACDVCVIALVVKPYAWHQSAIPTWQKELMRQVTLHTPTIVSSLGIADLLDEYPDAALKIVTYSDVPAAQTALVERIMGTA
jgi:beta-glucosidase-like glycosyl hydrolase